MVVGLALTGGQDPPRYTDAHLDCAVFHERVRTTLRLQGGRGAQEERGGREGLIRLRTRRERDLVRFEAWYDTLAVWRETPLAQVRPDTDGLVGGRWLGWLGPTGGVELDARPFMPPAVREVADLSESFADFFPPLPAIEPAVDGRWEDGAGLAIERQRDSAAPRPIRRYSWRTETVVSADTGLRLGERVADRGFLAWDDSLGPVGWTRDLTIDAQLRPRPRAAVRSRVEQRITVRRITNAGACR